jgi:hypothetical protein
VGVAVSRSPASAGVTSARPRIAASTFPCVERWTRRAVFDGWPSPNRTLPTSGCLVSSPGHRPTGSSRLPAMTRATRAAATHARESVRTYLPEAPSVVVVPRAHRVTPVLAIETLRFPGLFGAKLRAPVHRRLTPDARVSGTCGRPPARPAPFEHESKDAYDATSASHFLRSSTLVSCVPDGGATGDPGLSRDQDRFGGGTCVGGGRLSSRGSPVSRASDASGRERLRSPWPPPPCRS